MQGVSSYPQVIPKVIPKKHNPPARNAVPPARDAVPPANNAVPPCKLCRWYRVIPKLSPKLSPRDTIPLQEMQYPLQNVQHPLQIMQYLPANNAGGIELSPSYPQSYPQETQSPCKKCSTPCKLCSTPCKRCSTPCKLCSTPCKYCSTSLQTMQGNTELSPMDCG